jgi:hypothetical protein
MIALDGNFVSWHYSVCVGAELLVQSVFMSRTGQCLKTQNEAHHCVVSRFPLKLNIVVVRRQLR